MNDAAPMPKRSNRERADVPAGRVPKAQPIVRMLNVSKRYSNGVVAIEGVTLEINEGDFVSLVGPSGCGKSTLLRMIAGLSKPSTGTIEYVPGLNHVYEAGGNSIGFVFQDPTLLPWKTVSENVALPLRIWKRPESEIATEVSAALSLVGLGNFEAVFPRQLSGGMKMRVSIARALVTRPRLLLMDEPFAALDEITRAKMDDDLLDIWRQTKSTVVFVTHSTPESVYLSTRVVGMAAHPGRTIGSVDIDYSSSRTSNFRTCPEFFQLAADVAKLLQ